MKRLISLVLVFCSVPSFVSAQGQKTITLEEAYERTLASDQSIQIAYWEVRKAKLQPWSAIVSRLGPQLNANAAYDANWTTTRLNNQGSQSAGLMQSGSGFSSSRSVSSPSHQFSRSTSGAVSFSLDQPLFDATVIPAYRLGKLTESAARLQRTATVRDTLFGLAQAYYDVLKQQSIVSVNRQTVDLASGQLDLAEKRFSVGDVARTDVSRARATLENARRALIESENALATSRNVLGNILNFGGDTGFAVVEPASAPFVDEAFESVLRRAMSLREDYRIAQLTVEQDIARRNIVAAEYAPRIVVQGDQSWTSSASHPASSVSGRDASSVGIAVQLPILDRGQREIDLRTASHQIQEAKLNLEQTEKSVQEQVKNAWLAVRSLREALKAVTAEVEASELNYRDLQAQYEAGAAISLDVQAALRELNNSRASLAANRYDYQVALRNLERVQAVFQSERVARTRMK